LSTKVEQRLQWRRDKVRELSVKGYNQRQIATTRLSERKQAFFLPSFDNMALPHPSHSILVIISWMPLPTFPLVRFQQTQSQSSDFS
jgi:hypothetical protein